MPPFSILEVFVMLVVADVAAALISDSDLFKGDSKTPRVVCICFRRGSAESVAW